MKNEKVQETHQISIPNGATKSYSIMESPSEEKIKIMVEGALLPEYYANLSTHTMFVWIQLVVTAKEVAPNASLEQDDILDVMVCEIPLNSSLYFHLM